MGQYFALNYTGGAFVLFGPAHLAAMGILAATYLSLLYFRTVWDEPARRRFRVGLAIFLYCLRTFVACVEHCHRHLDHPNPPAFASLQYLRLVEHYHAVDKKLCHL